ncbi:MAG: hypothetical protein AAF555_07180 [Verrucomicrobiota bacterium]
MILLVGLLAGCAQVINPWDLARIDRQSEARGLSRWFYAGSDSGWHVLENHDGRTWRRYRIAEDDLLIEAPFPLTETRREWRKIDP